MERVKYGVLFVHFQDNLLQVRSQPDHPTIDATVVQNLNTKIAEAERVVAEESARDAAKHKQTLDELSKATSLPVQ